MAYKLSLPLSCAIHHVFHVSQLRKAERALQKATKFPDQLIVELEMVVEPEFLLDVRPVMGKNLRDTNVLIQWKGVGAIQSDTTSIS